MGEITYTATIDLDTLGEIKAGIETCPELKAIAQKYDIVFDVRLSCMNSEQAHVQIVFDLYDELKKKGEGSWLKELGEDISSINNEINKSINLSLTKVESSYPPRFQLSGSGVYDFIYLEPIEEVEGAVIIWKKSDTISFNLP